MVDKKSNIGYVGNVSVKIAGSKSKLKKQYKVKNKGYLPLFKFISYCLSGSFSASLCPAYIVTYNVPVEEGAIKANEEDFYTSAVPTCNKPIFKASSTPTEDSDNKSTVELTFTIPGTAFLEGEDTNCLALYCDENYNTFDSTNKSPSAIVILDSGIEVETDESVVVVWQLTIGNNVDNFDVESASSASAES